MPNKTIYVRDADLPLWDLATSRVGKSISSIFSEFLRNKFPENIDVFIHIVNSGRGAEIPSFLVMFAAVDEANSGEPMTPHSFKDVQELTNFLMTIGLTESAVKEIVKELQVAPSVSKRANLKKNLTSTNFYFLRFTPIPVNAGTQSYSKAEVHAVPASPLCKSWKATFHNIQKLIDTLEDQLPIPPHQLASIRQLLEEGKTVEVGGSRSGIRFVVNEEQVMQLGLVREDYLAS